MNEPVKKKRTRKRRVCGLCRGATEGTRTPDLLITNQLLYQLSHSSIFQTSKEDRQNPLFSIADFARFVKGYFTRKTRKRHLFCLP